MQASTLAVPCAADYQWPSSKKISADCKDIVAKILVVDVNKRITVAEIQVWLITSLRSLSAQSLARGYAYHLQSHLLSGMVESIIQCTHGPHWVSQLIQ